MTRTTPSLLAVFGAIALAAVLTGAPTAAFAHDELVDSSPSAGEQLTEAPAEVHLQFSGEVMSLGAAVVVADADGYDWVAEQPTVNLDGIVTVVLRGGMPDAGYEMRWRVVSRDGHPISGIVPFTIGDGEPLTREPLPSASAGDDTGTDDTNGQITQEGGIPRVAAIGAIGATAGAAVFALALFITRRLRRRAAGTDTDTADAESSVDEPEGTL